MNRATTVIVAILVTTAALSAVVGAGASTTPSQRASATAQGDGYAGTHVAFDAEADALANYRIGGERVFENVSVAAREDHRDEVGLGGDVDLSVVANLAGVGIDLETTTETRAEIATEGTASLAVHDAERGILTVDAGGEAQYVKLALAGDASASEDGETVVVDSGERTGALVVVGDGAVAINDAGDVTADLGSESTLVFRSYPDGERDGDDVEQERLIAEGTATAEVYADEYDGERLVDVATYGQDLAVEVTDEGTDRLEMTVERAESEGTVVIASVTETALTGAERAEDLAVTVDGEAAVEASSYGDLAGGVGEEPRFLVTQSGEASADVLVAIDHFSEREVSIESDDGSEDDSVPGFGAGGALVALLAAAAARVRT